MSDVRIKVPEGMLKAVETNMVHNARQLSLTDADVTEILEAALRWLSENPIVPTVAQWSDIYHNSDANSARWRAVEWQRRMFLAPEKPLPDPFESLLDRMEADAPAGAYRLEIHSKEGTLLAVRQLSPKAEPVVPEVNEEVRTLLLPLEYGTPSMILDSKIMNERIIEAFRRGQQSAKK